ncbi:hypothetical protein ACET3Z_004335 [Daucus carota]
MAVYALLICAVLLDAGSLASSKQIVADHSGYPPDRSSICEDEALTKGYKCEDYDVITEDGYVLRLERFPQGQFNHRGRRNKPPVFIHHADHALPFILLEAGFDVWVGNTRGTRFSRKHISENFTYSDDYWDFSFSEMGQYDLPASLKFVYQQTGQKVHYVGHSLGTTMFFSAFTDWKVDELVKSATLLSPIAFLKHMTTLVGNIAAHAYLGEIVGTFGIPFLDLKIEPLSPIEFAFCNVPGVDCWTLSAIFTGPNCCMNASTVNLFLHSNPQATSIKNLVHLSQNIRTGVFSKYDYGNPASNLEHYGVPEAPVYDLEISIPKHFPLLLCYGGKDALSDPKDVYRILSDLRSHTNIHEIYIDHYAHLDFINGITAKDILFPDVVNFMKEYN